MPNEDDIFNVRVKDSPVPRTDRNRKIYTVSDILELLSILEREGCGDYPLVIENGFGYYAISSWDLSKILKDEDDPYIFCRDFDPKEENPEDVIEAIVLRMHDDR